MFCFEVISFAASTLDSCFKTSSFARDSIPTALESSDSIFSRRNANLEFELVTEVKELCS